MQIQELQQQARQIWGQEKLSLSEIIVRMGVVFGTICRWERNEKEDADKHTEQNLKMKMGHMIFSTIRWCEDLGFDPEDCIKQAIKSQEDFVKSNKK